MSGHNFKKVASPAAETFSRDIELSAEAKSLLSPQLSPADFLEGLLAAGHYGDAVNFMARALPKREATWWACLCARSALGENPPAPYVQALAAAEQWVYTPSEENRRLAMAAAEATPFDHPAAWAAVAAFWSGGSLAPENVPAVPPADNLNAKAVIGAVRLAVVIREPEKAAEKYRLFLEQAIDIANGGDGRKVAPTAPGA
ncbi:hypothetical protein [Methylococcus sp. EFPC2]|uniref:DUF6931 family protein n=1 Tax=Methylococcus sp. EFPC2 TaxID=2812648 RepID=UPI001966F13A|nr:hypothetical protein [Methylococcus sp. EFPC2]QSA96394.1 hypothetical protein JWZ97_14375 [Methylococcus sp. EFPC2]